LNIVRALFLAGLFCFPLKSRSDLHFVMVLAASAA